MTDARGTPFVAIQVSEAGVVASIQVDLDEDASNGRCRKPAC